MDQTLVLEQDEQVSTLASNPAFISALKDININCVVEGFGVNGDVVIRLNHA
jgi:hypothetical protein